jgi:1,4-alpha-glucan branching enzyme
MDPGGGTYAGGIDGLDGAVSCSVVVDPDTVTQTFKQAEIPEPPGTFVRADDFWKNEFDPNRPVPARVEDLVIYELHVGALGFGKPDVGNFSNAIALLDSHLVPLGVNAIELLPMAEFGGIEAWGYGNTHHFAVEFRGGGRDQFKHFVRECHRRGIAVILDVVYNHFALGASRAQWQYDSVDPKKNIYYWYEGSPSDYKSPNGGYLNNGSSGWAPRYWEEEVRKVFVSSAAALVDEFHQQLIIDINERVFHAFQKLRFLHFRFLCLVPC